MHSHLSSAVSAQVRTVDLDEEHPRHDERATDGDEHRHRFPEENHRQHGGQRHSQGVLEPIGGAERQAHLERQPRAHAATRRSQAAPQRAERR